MELHYPCGIELWITDSQKELIFTQIMNILILKIVSQIQ